MICFILKIRMSNCLLQSVTWQLYELIQIVYTSRVVLELFIEVLSHNKSLSNVAISGPNTVNTNPADVCKALKAIFDEPKERTTVTGRRHTKSKPQTTKMYLELKLSDNYKIVQSVLFVFHVVNLAL